MKHLKKKEELSEVHQQRNMAALGGGVHWIELEADAFACHYLGKEKMIKHFEYLKKAVVNREMGELTLEEVERRSNAIKEL